MTALVSAVVGIAGTQPGRASELAPELLAGAHILIALILSKGS